MVGSFAVSLAVLLSLAVLTVAVLMVLAGAEAETATDNRTVLVAPAARPPARVQVTLCPAAVHDQPEPVAPAKLCPVGRASVTVTEPVVAPAPTLRTVRS